MAIEKRILSIQEDVFRIIKEHLDIEFYINITLIDIDRVITFSENYHPKIGGYSLIYEPYKRFMNIEGSSLNVKKVLDGEEISISRNLLEKKLEKNKTDTFLINLFDLTNCNNIYYLKVGEGGDSIGLLVLLTKDEIPENKKNSIKSIAHKNLLVKYVQLSRIKFFNQKNILKSHATRAAISQVMARNMSHNIGSHVLSKLLNNSQIHDIYKPERWQCTNNIDEKPNDDSSIDHNENYTLLANFFSYLKSRMDFLADVTTSTPVIENTMGIYNDIVKEFIQNRVLNDRISGISNFNYKIIVCKPSDNGLDCKKTATDKCNCIISEDKNNDDIKKVAVPNDVLGCHAFYTILENIIRNTAKHGKKDDVEIKIKIEEASDYINKNKGNLNLNEYYAVSVFDNCNYDANIDTNDWPKDDKEKYKDLIKNNKIKRIDKLVYYLNKKLNKSILKEGQLRHGAWGLIEMAASATYLRKISVNKIDSDDYKVNDLNGKSPLSANSKLCVLQAYAEQNKYLGYRFFMYKPREILIIDGGSDKEVLGMPNDEKEQYKANGIWIKSKNDFKKELDNKTIFPHKLVVIVGANNADLYSAIKNNSCFTKRIFKVNNLDYNLSNDIKAFKDSIWQCYFKNSKLLFYENNCYKGYKSIENEESVVDSHANDYCQKTNGHKDKKDAYNFVEIGTSATSHFFMGMTGWLRIVKYASWPIKVLVLDERIQDFAYKEKYAIKSRINCNPEGGQCYHKDGVPYHLIYKNTNITVPNIEDCDLNAQNFYFNNKEGDDNSEYIKIKKVISSFIKTNKDEQYFIVIHLGIIEKLIAACNINDNQNYKKDDKTETAEFIKVEILKSENKDAYDNIVVTSGRGTPHNIPSNIRYLNFSIISQYLITLRNKYAFTEALYSARKTKK